MVPRASRGVWTLTEERGFRACGLHGGLQKKEQLCVDVDSEVPIIVSTDLTVRN